MAGNVTLHPSGRQFENLPQQSILESGLASGLALPHRCSNGSCGSCKARLLDGDVARLKSHDFTLSGREKADNAFLMCCHSTETGATIVVDEVESPDDIPLQQIQAKVVNILPIENGNTVIATLKLLRGKAMQFLSGQSIELDTSAWSRTENDGDKTDIGPVTHLTHHQLVLPIASCPCETGIIELHVNQDLWQKRLAGLKKGQRLELSGPRGEFTLSPPDDMPTLFIAMDEGFARSKALIEQIFNLQHEQPVHLIRLNRDEQTPYLDNLCRSWNDVTAEFSYENITRLTALEERINDPFIEAWNPAKLPYRVFISTAKLNSESDSANKTTPDTDVRTRTINKTTSLLQQLHLPPVKIAID